MPQTPAIFPTALELSALDSIIGTVFNGVSNGDQSGISVASAGDMNGDGLSDVIIGAPGADSEGRPGAGSSFVVFGTNKSFDATLELSALNGTNGFRINGVSANDYSGISVASAGDMNGDGLSDLIVGAYWADPNGQSDAGSSFVVFGSNKSFGAVLELSQLNGTNGFRINGVSANDYSGNPVASAGDMNGDGLSDLIIGAFVADPDGRSNAGSSFVVFGSNKSFGAVLELSQLNGTNGFRINGALASDRSGNSVANVGDMNGDGLSDLIIGAYTASPGERSNAGSSFVVFGTNKSFGAVLELSALNGINGFRINGVSTNDKSGTSVASAGDVNGDGLIDLIIGASGASPGGRNSAGSSFVVFGTNKSFGATLELSALNGTNGFRINGVSANDNSGRSVARVGDMNGDGLDDLIIGAVGVLSSGQTYAGSNFVVFGSNKSFGVVLELSTLNGANGYRINGGDSIASAGDINGDSLSDLIVGVPEASPGGRNIAGSSFVIFGDSIQLAVNKLIIPAGGSEILTHSSLNALVFCNPEYTQYDITALQHGYFRYTAQPGTAITRFSREDVIMERVSFIHDDSELPPSYSVTASHTLATTLSYPANITFINQLPLLVNNSLIINQGQTIQLDNTMLAAVDPDNAQHNSEIIFTILGSSNGFFSTFSFSQSQVWNGGVYFTQDNTIRPPQYTINISRGGVTIGPYFPVIDFDTTPVLQQNRFDICQGQTKRVTSDMLSAIHPGNFSSDTLIFSIKNLQYSRFEHINISGTETSTFSQTEVQNGSIQFVHDGSPNPPSFTLTVGDNRITTSPSLGGIYFTYAPVLKNNALTLSQGQTVVFNDNMLNAVNPNTLSEDLVFTVSEVKQGIFINVKTTQNITQFNQSQLSMNQIAFKADSSPVTPSYSISVRNRCSQTRPAAADINFNSAPVITNNQLTITNGQPIILTSIELSATDRETPLADLGFTLSGIQYGYFDTISLPGTPIKVFPQQMIFNGVIRFVPENSFSLPAYNVSVNDGVLWTEPQAALVRLNTLIMSNAPIQNSNTIENAIIGSAISGIIGLGFFAFKYFLNKRMNDKLKNMLKVDESEVEKEQEAWKRETLLPVVREVFNHLKTTGLCGFRDEAATKEYVQGIELLLTELERQGIEIDLTKLSVTEQRRLLNAIVKEIQAQLVKPRSCCSKGWFMSFTRPAFKAAELNGTASAIAKVVAIKLKQGTEIDKIRGLPHRLSDSALMMENYVELKDVEEQKISRLNGKNGKTSLRASGKN